MSEPTFFVVRVFNGKEMFALEYGDFSGGGQKGGYTKENRRSIVDRFELPAGYSPTLDEAIAGYKAGVRLKPIPKPAPVVAKTYSSVRRKHLPPPADMHVGDEVEKPKDL